MDPGTLEAIMRLTARERLLIASSRGAAMDGSPDKLAALADVVGALDRLRILHALVGGVVIGIRSGVPRATLDTDIAVRSAAEPGSITRALTGAGLHSTGTFAHRCRAPARRRSRPR